MSTNADQANPGNASEKGVSVLFAWLCVLYVACLLLSNLLAGKLIAFGGVVLQAVDLLFPLIYVLGDVFTEVYGFRRARSAIWMGFACNLLAVGVCYAAVRLPAPGFWHDQPAYETVFALTPRVFAGSIVAYLAGEFSNAYVLERIKRATSGRRLWVRTIGSSLVGEGLDTVLFTTIVFAGVLPLSVLLKLIFFQYVWKIAYEALLTPVTYCAVGALKRAEKVS